MGVPSGLFDSVQTAAIRGLELVALRQSILSAVPACPAVSLACPPANVSCPPLACPPVTCSPPACPAPLVNLSCPSLGPSVVNGLDGPSAFWGAVAGLSAGLGLGGVTWRRDRAPSSGSGLGDRAREQVRLLRQKHGDAR